MHLSADARAVIDRQQRDGNSAIAFPSPADPDRPCGSEPSLWNLVRERAGLSGVRLHDTRHTYASHAVMTGVPLPVVARLLGHRQPRTTMRIGAAISLALDGDD